MILVNMIDQLLESPSLKSSWNQRSLPDRNEFCKWIGTRGQTISRLS